MKKISMLIISLTTLVPALSFAEEIIDVLEKGFDDGVKTTRQQDYMEAVMDAKLKAIEKAGVEIKAITEVENFQVRYDLVESRAEGILLPGFRIEDIGYMADGTYQVVLIGKIKVVEKEKPPPPEKGFGALVITSTPPGAKVYIDGQEKVGRTPFQDLNIPAGEHEVRLTLEGYADYTKRVRIKADDITREDVVMVRAKVSVIISSDPIEAAVYFDGQLAGKTPVTIPNVVAGRHTILLSKEGYANHQETIEVGNETVRFIKKLGPPETEYVKEGRYYRKGQDGKEMMWIPGGTFTMGSNDGASYEKPTHQVTVNGFWMDITEVTNTEFSKFRSSWSYDSSKTNHPAVNVAWNDAVAYCKWAGKRLPTEAEWEYAVGGPEHYKWALGNTFDASKYSFNKRDIEPVGSYPANGYGLYDMSGSVWEWVNDWYDSTYYSSSPSSNPQGPSSGRYRVLRGGSWVITNPNYLRVAYRLRYDPDWLTLFGFRCLQ